MKTFIALLFTAALAVVAHANPTIEPCGLSQPASRPGYAFSANFRWEAETVSPDQKVFVHILNSAGAMVFQADHDLPVATSKWTGHVAYDVPMSVPAALPTGTYTIYAGLWNPANNSRLPLAVVPGVTDRGDKSYNVGAFSVSPTAPLPKLPMPTLDLTAYHVTFEENFTGPLSVSAHGPGTKWISHMPDFPDFGSGKFSDPQPGFPFTVGQGMLAIQLTKKNGQWVSGLLSSVDPKGNGFSQQYGYFEMQAKLPKGEGVWPAFWLMKPPTANDANIVRVEIDVMEQFGARPNDLHSTVHFWGPGPAHRSIEHVTNVGGMTDDFHRYGVSVQADFTMFYFDGSEVWRMVTPEEAKVPLYLLVDLALGAGWPIDKTPDPSFLYVDYIRAYAKDQ